MIQDLTSFFQSTLYTGSDKIAAQVENRVHYGMIPDHQANTFPRLFLLRDRKGSKGDLDRTADDYYEDVFSLEVISDDVSDVDTISDLLWQYTNLYIGPISTDVTVLGLFLENQDDDYLPKGIGGDIGLDVASFSLRVVHR